MSVPEYERAVMATVAYSHLWTPDFCCKVSWIIRNHLYLYHTDQVRRVVKWSVPVGSVVEAAAAVWRMEFMCAPAGEVSQDPDARSEPQGTTEDTPPITKHNRQCDSVQ